MFWQHNWEFAADRQITYEQSNKIATPQEMLRNLQFATNRVRMEFLIGHLDRPVVGEHIRDHCHGRAEREQARGEATGQPVA